MKWFLTIEMQKQYQCHINCDSLQMDISCRYVFWLISESKKASSLNSFKNSIKG